MILSCLTSIRLHQASVFAFHTLLWFFLLFICLFVCFIFFPGENSTVLLLSIGLSCLWKYVIHPLPDCKIMVFSQPHLIVLKYPGSNRVRMWPLTTAPPHQPHLGLILVPFSLLQTWKKPTVHKDNGSCCVQNYSFVTTDYPNRMSWLEICQDLTIQGYTSSLQAFPARYYFQ